MLHNLATCATASNLIAGDAACAALAASPVLAIAGAVLAAALAAQIFSR